MRSNLDLRLIQEQLEEERASLLRRIDDQETRLRGRAEASPDRLDLASDYRVKGRTIVMLAQSRRQLEQVEAALSRLEDGTYGTCTRCGVEITPERIHVVPHAPLCIGCQQKLDQTRARSALRA